MEDPSSPSHEPRESILLNDAPGKQEELGKPMPMPAYVREINKLSNTVISSATIALIRTLANRPAASPPPENLPPWFASEYTSRSGWQSFLRQYGRDTVILTGAAYLMDGVEYAAKSVRGTDKDPANKMIGGAAAGGVLGLLWYPANPTGRAVMTAAGALVGYLTFTFEKTTKVVLFEQQRKLEKDLLHKKDEDVRSELDPPYLRHLLRIKQQQLLAEHQQQQQKLKEEHQQQMQGRAGGSPGSLPRPGAEGGEEWRSWQAPSSSSGGSGGGGAPQGGQPTSLWSQAGSREQPQGQGSPPGDARSDVSAGSGRDQGDVLRIGDGGFTPKELGRPGDRAPHSTPAWQPGGSGRKWDSKQQQGDAEWLVINDEAKS